MKLKYVNETAVENIKQNIKTYAPLFSSASSANLEDRLGMPLFTDTTLDEVPDFELCMDKDKAHETDVSNIKTVYGNLKFLTDSEASDEGVWAGMCLGPFWGYVKYRWASAQKCSASGITSHFLFGHGARRSLFRNALARLWWIGRLTYDDNRDNPWELTEYVGQHPDTIFHIFDRTTSNNPGILHPFIDALIDADKAGLHPNTTHVGALEKYLNRLGGTYVLDCVPADVIRRKVLDELKAIQVWPVCK